MGTSHRSDVDAERPLLAGDEASYDTTNTTEAQPVRGFGKQLNALNGYALLIGCIIGSGIFASPAAVDTNVPSPGIALVIWLVGGLLAWTGAATLAELGTALPGEGSVQEYLKYVYGDFAGFLAAYAWIVAIVPSTLSILCIVFVETVYSAANPAGEGAPSGWAYKGFAILVLVADVLLNCANTKTNARLGNIFAIIKLVSVALPVLAGLVVAIIYAADQSKDFSGKDWHNRGWFDMRASWYGTSDWEALGHYSTALYASLWAYCGWDGANYIAAELQDPGRQLPLALNTAIPTVMLSYVLVNASYYILLPWSVVGQTDAIAVTAIKALLGKAAGIMFAILICLVIVGALSSNVFVAGRLTVAAANKSYIPTLFGRIGRMTSGSPSNDASAPADAKSNAPFNALVLSTILTSLYIIFGNFRALLTFIGLTQYIFFSLTVIGALILRRREPDLHRPFKPPILVPLLFAVVAGLVAIRGAVFAPVQLGVLAAELVIGAVFYWSRRWWFKRREPRRA